MTADMLAAELAAIEDRQENGDLRDFATSDSPRLLKALRAVAEVHVPYGGDTEAWCAYDGFDWPCQDYRLISSALLGEAGTDG